MSFGTGNGPRVLINQLCTWRSSSGTLKVTNMAQTVETSSRPAIHAIWWDRRTAPELFSISIAVGAAGPSENNALKSLQSPRSRVFPIACRQTYHEDSYGPQAYCAILQGYLTKDTVLRNQIS